MENTKSTIMLIVWCIFSQKTPKQHSVCWQLWCLGSGCFETQNGPAFSELSSSRWVSVLISTIMLKTEGDQCLTCYPTKCTAQVSTTRWHPLQSCEHHTIIKINESVCKFQHCTLMVVVFVVCAPATWLSFAEGSGVRSPGALTWFCRWVSTALCLVARFFVSF